MNYSAELQGLAEIGKNIHYRLQNGWPVSLLLVYCMVAMDVCCLTNYE